MSIEWMREHDNAFMRLRARNQFLICLELKQLGNEQDDDVTDFRGVFDRRNQFQR